MSQSYNNSQKTPGTYVPVNRDFGTGPNRNDGRQLTGLLPMQRWLAEVPGDLPYHTVGAVGDLMHTGTSAAKDTGMGPTGASSSNRGTSGSHAGSPSKQS